VFISFKKLADDTGFLPKIRWQTDGVHLTDEAAVAFNDAFEKAAKSDPGTIIFVDPTSITKNADYTEGGLSYIKKIIKEFF